MRIPTQLALAFAFVSTASAEAPTKSTPKTIATGTDVCKELGTGGGKCAAGAKLKAKAGNATIYRVDGDQVRIAMVIDMGKDSKDSFLSPPFDQNSSDCGAGKCTNLDKATAKLSEVKIGSSDAIVLDITSSFTHQLNEPPKTKTTWQTHTFVVCGKGSKGWSCLTASYGGRDNPCTASISKTGEIKHTCTETEFLAF